MPDPFDQACRKRDAILDSWLAHYKGAELEQMRIIAQRWLSLNGASWDIPVVLKRAQDKVWELL